MGQNTMDEMCFTNVLVVRPANATGWPFQCSGDIWAGEFALEDDPRKVAEQHPFATAVHKWTGEPDGNAGKRIGRRPSMTEEEQKVYETCGRTHDASACLHRDCCASSS